MNIDKEMAISSLESLLQGKEELSHLKVRYRGDLLILESASDKGDIYPHARFRRRTKNIWMLEMPVKRGWESTFIEGSIEALLQTLVEKFPWTLANF